MVNKDTFKNPLAKQLIQIILDKQSNLCLSADVTCKKELLRLADQLGPKLCMLKTHIDIIEDFDMDLTEQLQTLAKKHHFLLFEDRKFADIGHTVQLQYEKGIYHIADWADIVNAHSFPGSGIVEGLKQVGLPKGRGLLLLAQMSSKGCLSDDRYVEKTLQMAREHADFVMGFVTQSDLGDNQFLNFTPGVKLQVGADQLGQQYVTPEMAIRERKADVIIVGRGIYHHENPIEEAERYRVAAWGAYS